jgi:hypothetical protein
MKTIRATWAASLALVFASVVWTAPALAGDKNVPRVSPPASQAYGKTLGQWLSAYWRWFYSGADPAQGQIGGVKLMPLPEGIYDSGGWTPDDPALLIGEINVTLCPGTPFVLPLVSWVGERYGGYPGVPDDQAIADAKLLAGVSPTFTIDGRTVVTDANEAAFYVGQTYFDPIVVYPQPSSYDSVAAVFFQGTGIVSPPLPVGQHTMHLVEPYIIRDGDYLPGFSWGFIYDNTWNVTVTPRCNR